MSQVERSIKSASLKRKSKNAKRRFFTLSSNICKNEDNTEQRKNSMDPRTNDVVTMVSLINLADNDSDIDNSSNENKLINELHNKLSTTSIIKTSINTSPDTTRKSMKSGMYISFIYFVLYININFSYKYRNGTLVILLGNSPRSQMLCNAGVE